MGGSITTLFMCQFSRPEQAELSRGRVVVGSSPNLNQHAVPLELERIAIAVGWVSSRKHQQIWSDHYRSHVADPKYKHVSCIA